MTVAKTVTIPVSQLVEANRIVDKIRKALREKHKTGYSIAADIDLVNHMKKLKDCITITD